MLNHLAEYVRMPDGRLVQFGGEEPARRGGFGGTEGATCGASFGCERQCRSGGFRGEGIVIEKRLLLIHGQNTVHVTYSLLSAHEAVRLELRPSLHFRPHENDVAQPLEDAYWLAIRGQQYEVAAGEPYPPLRFTLYGEAERFMHEGGLTREIAYETEAERGYHSRGMLWSPGRFAATLKPGRDVTLVASTEAWSTVEALSPDDAFTADSERRRRLLAAAHPAVREGARGRTRARGRSIHHDARRSGGRRRARAGGGR